MQRFAEIWLPRALFVVTLALAGGLAGLVLVAPWLVADGAHRLIVLFAEDLVVRRTALCSALGLVATAFVFFRPKAAAKPEAKPETTHATGA